MNLRHGAISVFASVSSLLLLVLPIAKAQQLQSSGSSSQKSAASEQAATMQPTPRITQAIDDTSVVRIPRTTHPLATPANDRGRADADLPMNRIVLVLKPSVLQQAALTKLIDSQHDPESPNFQHWLTPEQYAAQFAPAQSDLEQITSWLRQLNFTVASIARGGQWIEFSGTAGQVEAAFHTEIHNYVVDGEPHVANATDIFLPQALAPVVSSVLSLHDFRPKPLHTGGFQVQRSAATGKLMPLKTNVGASPDFTPPGASNPSHFLAPGDWSTIYNTAPLLAQGITGSGISIAVVGSDSNIQLSDIITFRQIFNLSPKYPDVIVNGLDPGIQSGSEAEVEADLDVEWSGAVAPQASIKFVTTASTFTTFGGLLSISYIVDNRLAPIMSSSIGECEAFLGTGGNAFLNSAYEQAAAEGISIFVASGDTGAAGCDPQGSLTPAQNGANVSGYASTPYNMAVGGTMFAENGLDGNYWSTSNQPNLSSVIGYIPEAVWNESCDPTTDPTQCGGTNEYFLVAGGGGSSNCTQSTVQNELIFCQSGYSKPSWQSGKGVPNDGARDIPDIAFTAAGSHDGYLMCVEGSCQAIFSQGQATLEAAFVVGGTSAAAPSMSGLMALVEQNTGAYQGLVNYNFYKLAAAENLSACNSSHMTNPSHSSTCIFNDVTSGNNNVPGQPGFNATTGYDLSTGLGSLNAVNLLNSWGSIAKLPTSTKLLASAVQIQHGQPIPMTVAVKPSSGSGVPTGNIAFLTKSLGSVFGGTLVNGSFAGNVTDLPGGSYNVEAQYSGDAMFAASTSGGVTVNVTPEDSIVNVQPVEINSNGVPVPVQGPVLYGAPFGLQISVQGKSGIGLPTGTATVLQGHTTPLGNLLLNQSGSAFIPFNSSVMPVGNHTFTITYNGDDSFLPASTSFTVNVIKGLSTATITPVQTAYTEGVPIELVFMVAAQGEKLPTGTVQLYDCGSNSSGSCPNGTSVGTPLGLSESGPLGFGPAIGASQAVYRGVFPAGNHTLKLAYSGDLSYNPIAVGSSSSKAELINVKALTGMKPNIAMLQSSNVIFLGDSDTYIVSVKASQPKKPIPTGTVSISDQFGDFLGSPVSLSNGNATLVVPWNHAGSFLIVAKYSGDTNYAPLESAALATTIVQVGQPELILASSVATVQENTNTLLAVTVLLPPLPNLTSPVAEGGQVEFLDFVNGADPIVLGSGPQPLTTGNGGNGIAVLSVVLPPGQNFILVQFLGTQDWQSQLSNYVLVQVKTPPPPPTTSGWTWVTGTEPTSETGSVPGVYGTLGKPAAGNTPGARGQGQTWTDAAGNLWLFGGYGADSKNQSGDLNDLWKFSGGQWTWVSGSNLIEQPGIYGTKGKPSPDNIPGARFLASSSKDASGNLWLYGGTGIDSTGTRGLLTDLWKYSNGEWTWVAGSNLGYATPKGVYGTKGKPAPDNAPGQRSFASSWVDGNGNFWLFGGEGVDPDGKIGPLNDLWKYSNGEWTWMSGSNTLNQSGTYGTKGTAAPGNVPGARSNATSWTDAAGNLWLFGGAGNGGALIGCVASPCELNDLWKYSAGEWTWMGGSKQNNQAGVYGTQGIADPANFPGARDTAASFMDASGNLWLFGGVGIDAEGGHNDLSDLWKFSNGEWTWVGGSNLEGRLGTYGTKGVTTASNIPGARDGAMCWVDASGNFWLFGGDGLFVFFDQVQNFNDMWEYKP